VDGANTDDYASIVPRSQSRANDNGDVASSNANNYNDPVVYSQVQTAQKRDLSDLHVYTNAS